MQITNPMRKTLFAIMCVLIGLIENVAEFFIRTSVIGQVLEDLLP